MCNCWKAYEGCGILGVVSMKENINNAIEVLAEISERLFCFFILMFVITIISIVIISIFNKDIILKILCINMFIGLIPLVIDVLIVIILYLIKCIIYGED